MKAIQVMDFGSPQNMELLELPMLAPGEKEVLSRSRQLGLIPLIHIFVQEPIRYYPSYDIHRERMLLGPL